MFKKIYSKEELQREANNLSHYDGGLQRMPYVGENDDLLSFEGNINNFSAEGHDSTQFTFTLTNNGTGSATRTAVIWAGYQNGDATLCPGQMADGAFTDTAGNADLSGAASSSKTIRELKAYLSKTPSRVVRLKVVASVTAQISNDFTVQALSPFDDGKSFRIKPKNVQNQNVQQLGLVEMDVDMPFDMNHKISYPVLSGAVVTVTFFFGASINLSKTLQRRAAEGKHNVSLMGASNVAAATMRQKQLG